MPNAAVKLWLAAAVLMTTPRLHAWSEEKLGGYGVDLNAAVSVFGLSSGGYMAQQYHVAHSKQVMGVGLVAAGLRDCTDTQPGWLPLVTATQVCCHTAGNGLPFLCPPNLAASIAATQDAARAGHIDPTTSLANAKAFCSRER